MLLLGNRYAIQSILICEEAVYLGDLESCFILVKLLLTEEVNFSMIIILLLKYAYSYHIKLILNNNFKN